MGKATPIRNAENVTTTLASVTEATNQALPSGSTTTISHAINESPPLENQATKESINETVPIDVEEEDENEDEEYADEQQDEEDNEDEHDINDDDDEEGEEEVNQESRTPNVPLFYERTQNMIVEAPFTNPTATGEATNARLPPDTAFDGIPEIPDGVDPSFLAALPQEMREEVIAEHIR